MGNLGRNFLLAILLVAFVLPTASAGLVQVYINNSEDLVTSENPISIQQGKDFTITFHVGGPYRIESGDDNLSVYNLNMDVHFLNDNDMRDSCTMCAIPSYQALSDTEKDPGYDEYEARFYGDNPVFEGYSGSLEFSILMTNRTGGIVWSNVLEITMTAPSSDSESSSGFSLPGLPPVVEENFILIAGGLLGIIVLSFLIYTFVLAPEDTTADLFKEKESIDPLSKSLTGVGYDSDLPGDDDEEEEDDEEDREKGLLDDDEDEEEFDESKLLAELTGSQKLESSEDEEEEEPEEEVKKPAKKKVVKKAVKKKVVRKAAPPKDKPKKPEVNMGEGVIRITCPSCEKVHNVEDTTTKFICSCGRRIRV